MELTKILSRVPVWVSVLAALVVIAALLALLRKEIKRTPLCERCNFCQKLYSLQLLTLVCKGDGDVKSRCDNLSCIEEALSAGYR